MTRRNNKRPEGSSQTKVIAMEPIFMREGVRKRQPGGCVDQFIFVSFEEAFKANFADDRD